MRKRVLVLVLALAGCAQTPETTKAPAPGTPSPAPAPTSASSPNPIEAARAMLQAGNVKGSRATYARLANAPEAAVRSDAAYGSALINVTNDKAFASVPKWRKEWAALRASYPEHRNSPEINVIKRLLDALGAAANAANTSKAESDSLRQSNAALVDTNAGLKAEIAKKDAALKRVRSSLIKR
ncbi:MAG: hypothetical protein AAF493_02255 [Pseudomonadota bacterium]